MLNRYLGMLLSFSLLLCWLSSCCFAATFSLFLSTVLSLFLLAVFKATRCFLGYLFSTSVSRLFSISVSNFIVVFIGQLLVVFIGHLLAAFISCFLAVFIGYLLSDFIGCLLAVFVGILSVFVGSTFCCFSRLLFLFFICCFFVAPLVFLSAVSTSFS